MAELVEEEENTNEELQLVNIHVNNIEDWRLKICAQIKVYF